MKILKRIVNILLTLFSILLLIIMLVILSDDFQTGYLRPSNKNNTYLLVHANIVPMTKDTVLKNKSIYIKNGEIKEISEVSEMPGIETIDVNGSYIMPGLTDMHVHVWDPQEFGLYLSNGVTTVRNVWGMPMHLRWKKRIHEGTLTAPDFYTSGPKLTGWDNAGDDKVQLKSPEDARKKVNSYKGRGYDFIKTYAGLTPDLFSVIQEEASRLNMEVAAHPSAHVPYVSQWQRPVVSIEHAEEIVQQPLKYTLDTLAFKTLLTELHDGFGTRFTPTLIGYYKILEMMEMNAGQFDEQMSQMNPLIQEADSKAQYARWSTEKSNDSEAQERIKKQHEFHLYMLKALHDNGIPIISGTDAGIGITVPGTSLYDELLLYKEAGLNNYEVLQTTTVNPSQTHNFLASTGTVEVGKKANLIALTSNPLNNLEALREPEMVFVNGRRLEREYLDEMKDKGQNRKNLWISALRYAEYLVVER